MQIASSVSQNQIDSAAQAFADGATNSEATTTAQIEARLDSVCETIEKADSGIEADGLDIGNISLAPEEIATLRSLVLRYEQVIQEVDSLNNRLESLLQTEGIKGCES